MKSTPCAAMKSVCPALLLALCVLSTAHATSPATDGSQGGPTTRPVAGSDAGQRYYKEVCARCHEANIGPVLVGRGLPPEFFKAIARSGLNAMPSFRVTDIDDETLQAVARYLSTSKGKQ